MRFDIITIFPEMFASVFSGGVVKRALERETVRIAVHDLRNFTEDKHRQVDDRPYGGLEGMVLKPEPIFRAVEAVREDAASRVYILSPQGRPLDTALARELASYAQVILICGRYEGVDERVVEHLADGEISIGDYVLSGGELAAAVVVDAADDVAGRLGESALQAHHRSGTDRHRRAEDEPVAPGHGDVGERAGGGTPYHLLGRGRAGGKAADVHPVVNGSG